MFLWFQRQLNQRITIQRMLALFALEISSLKM